jgi:lambda family phage minor tail protein L
MSAIETTVRSPTPGEQVALFRFDASFVGGDVFYFVQGGLEPGGVTFGGQFYTAFDIEFSGLETNGIGSLPQPRLKIANTNNVIQTVINTYGDLTGCELRRVRTFKRHLDGQSEADPGAFFGPDVYRVERKVSENPIFVEWELSADFDQEGVKLPRRVAIRDTCLWRYRVWNATSNTFDYSKAQCPYTGDQAYDINNQPVADHLDKPARNLSCCRTRFGENADLPYGGFPGLARARQ